MRRLVLALTLVLTMGVPSTSSAAEVVVTATIGGQFSQYVPRNVVLPQGSKLLFAQGDPIDAHNVVSIDVADGRYLFESDTVGVGEITEVRLVELLSPGDYGFTCSLHPLMLGVLMVR